MEDLDKNGEGQVQEVSDKAGKVKQDTSRKIVTNLGIDDKKDLKYDHPKSQTNWGSQDFLYIARYQDNSEGLGGCLRLHFDGLKDKEKRMDYHINYGLIINNFDLKHIDDIRDSGLLKISTNWDEKILELLIKIIRKSDFGNKELNVEGKVFNIEDVDLNIMKKSFQLIGHSEQIDKNFLSIVGHLKSEGYFIDLKYLVDKEYSYLQDFLEKGKGSNLDLIYKFIPNLTITILKRPALRNIIRQANPLNLQRFFANIGKVPLAFLEDQNLMNILIHGKYVNLEWTVKNIKGIKYSQFSYSFISDLVCYFDLKGLKLEKPINGIDLEKFKGKSILELMNMLGKDELPDNLQLFLNQISTKTSKLNNTYKYDPKILVDYAYVFREGEGIFIQNKDGNKRYFVIDKIDGDNKNIAIDMKKRTIVLLPDRIEKLIALSGGTDKSINMLSKSEIGGNKLIIVNIDQIQSSNLELSDYFLFDKKDKIPYYDEEDDLEDLQDDSPQLTFNNYLNWLCGFINGEQPNFPHLKTDLDI